MHAVRDTLIGSKGTEITRGYSGPRWLYAWTVRTDHGRLMVEINKLRGKDGARHSIHVDDAPRYVLADIASVMISGSAACAETTWGGGK
jgi:hypothetical protein